MYWWYNLGMYNVQNVWNIRWCQPIHMLLSVITAGKHKPAHLNMEYLYAVIVKVKYGTNMEWVIW